MNKSCNSIHSLSLPRNVQKLRICKYFQAIFSLCALEVSSFHMMLVYIAHWTMIGFKLFMLSWVNHVTAPFCCQTQTLFCTIASKWSNKQSREWLHGYRNWLFLNYVWHKQCILHLRCGYCLDFINIFFSASQFLVLVMFLYLSKTYSK